MSEKYILELYSDATIAQKGTDSEKRQLRESLKWQIDSWGSVHGESRIEGLWYKLGNIDLGNEKVRAEITAFMIAERNRKGGNAGAEFEQRYAIVMRYIGIADALSAMAWAQRTAIVSSASVQAGEVRSGVRAATEAISATPAAQAPRAAAESSQGPDVQSPYNERTMAGYEKQLTEIRKRLAKGDAKRKALLVPFRAAMNHRDGINVSALQAEMRKINPEAKVSKNGTNDGYFGSMTLAALQGIAGIETDVPRPDPTKPRRQADSDRPKPDGAETRERSSRQDQSPASQADSPATPRDESPASPQGGASETGVPATGVPASESPTAPANPPAAQERARDSYAEDLKTLESRLWAWRAATKGADSLSNPKERESHSQLLDAATKALAASMTDFNEQYVAKKSNEHASKNSEYLKSVYNEIALYLRGEGKTANKHYRDPVSAEAILRGALGTKLQAPAFPSKDELLRSLDGNTKSLILSLIEAKTKQGKTFEEALGETLGNPTIKGAWDKVYESGFSKYEKDMAAAIGKVDAASLTPQEKAGLDQLKDMYGTTGWLDFKDRNKAMMVVGRDQLFAVGLGIAGAVLTSTAIGSTVGVPMMVAAASASALVGGSITTGASMVLEGKVYSGKELLQEGAINVGTFGVGGLIFKVARLPGVVAKIGTRGALGAEMAGDLSIGMSVDQIRSQFQGIDVSLAESLKNNLPWALLPLVFHGASKFSKPRVDLANRADAWLKRAQALDALGDTRASSAAVAQINDDIAAVRAAEAPAGTPPPAGGPTGTPPPAGGPTGTPPPAGGPTGTPPPARTPTGPARAATVAEAPVVAKPAQTVPPATPGPTAVPLPPVPPRPTAPAAPGAVGAKAPEPATAPKAAETPAPKSAETPVRKAEPVSLTPEVQAKIGALESDIEQLTKILQKKIEWSSLIDEAISNKKTSVELTTIDGAKNNLDLSTQDAIDKAKNAVSSYYHFAPEQIVVLRAQVKTLSETPATAVPEPDVVLRPAEPPTPADTTPTPASRPAEPPVPAEPPPAAAAPNPRVAPVDAMPAATVAGEVVTFDRFIANFESNLKKLKEGGVLKLGDTTITRTSGDYVLKAANAEPIKFPAARDGLNDLKRYIATNIAPDQMVRTSLSKDFNRTVESAANKEIQTGGRTYRINKVGTDQFDLEIKTADGGFRKISNDQLNALSDADANALIDSILGKGASGRFDSLFKNPFSAGNPMFDKVKDIKIKDMYGPEFLKKIPKKLIDWSVGDMWKELMKSWHLNALPFTGTGLGKIEMLRTLFTGRSSGGHLWSHSGSNLLPTAWTPSLKTLKTVGLITGVEFAVNGKDEIGNAQDFVNYAYDHKGEFANNYFNYIWFGWLGTGIIEYAEVGDIGAAAVGGIVGIGGTVLKKAGADDN